jgi:hypothetical protein
MFNIKLIQYNQDFKRLETIWDRLLSESPADNFFLTWDWLWNWWKLYSKKNDELTIFLFESNSRVVGIAPFYVRKIIRAGIFPVRRMMFIGSQEDGDGDVGSDYLDIICLEGGESSFVELIFTTVCDKDICDEILFSKMIASTESFNIFKKQSEKLGFLTQIANEYVSPYIALPPTWEEYINDLSSSMRYKIRDERRKCDRLGTISISRADNEHNLLFFMSELIRLHNKRWQARGMTGAFINDQFIGFHNELTRRLLKTGKLNLMLLAENGETRAVLYNIIYKNKIYFYQSGIETSEAKVAFGYVLHSHCIEDALRKGRSEYDFLPKGGSDDYKDRFANRSRILADLYIVNRYAVKNFVKVKETARSVHHLFKTLIRKAE